jgi:FAD/FMN-containing dehydrogenase
MSTTRQSPATSLRAAVPGRIVLPGDASWDAARRAWNLAVDQRPAAVAFPRTAPEVAAIVTAARERGLRVAAQTTGHAAGALGDLDGTVLIKTAELDAVAIDPAYRRARIGAGALWIEVTAPASEHGLAPLAGSSPDVGVTGYALGGGMSWLARRHGLAANSVVGVELVTADGRAVRCDAESEPELFWALRGGGGSFGVVTSLELELFPAHALYAGALLWPWERAAEVLHAWNEWQATAPEEITTSARILQLPMLPDLPAPVRGRALVGIDGAALADPVAGAELIAPLRALDPEIDTFAPVAPVALSRLHMDPEAPVPAMIEHGLLEPLPAEGIDALVAAAGPGSGSRLLMAELRQLGGAVGRPAPGGGALASIDAGLLLNGGGMVASRADEAAVLKDLDRLTRALRPWDTGRGYMNFAERPADASTLFPPDTYRRLQRIKAQVDPDDLFRSNHPIPPRA